MIKEVIDNWNKNKNKLEKYLKTTPQEKYGTYLDLVKLVVKYTLYNFTDYYDDEDLEQNVKTIYFGDYQGIDIYLIAIWDYPDIENIIYTHNYYGSCSGCDTLQMIQNESSNYGEGLPTERQVKDYMTLCLHLVEKMKYLKGADNDGVEIIEDKKIERLQWCNIKGDSTKAQLLELRENAILQFDKINEIIDYINKEDNK